MAMKKSDGSSHQQTLDKALDLVNYLATSGAAMSISEISEKLEVTRPTAYSVVNSLLAQDYLEKDAESGKYVIGYKVFVLGNFYTRRNIFLYATERYIMQLREKWGKRVNVGIFKPPMSVIIILSSDTSPIPRLPFGRLVSAHCSSLGKSILANKPVEQVKEWLDICDFQKLPVQGPPDFSQLAADLDEVRRTGYAVDFGETLRERVCIGAPIFDASGQVIAAISISDLYMSFFEDSKEHLRSDVMQVANSISIDLGYNGRNELYARIG